MKETSKKGFLILTNDLFAESGTMSEKGLLIRLLSNSETYEVSRAGIEKCCADGRVAIKTAVKKNITSGHITVIKVTQYRYCYIIRERAETNPCAIADQIEAAKKSYGKRENSDLPIRSNIIRENHADNFTVLDTEALRDERLSLAALYLFALVLRHQGHPGYHYSVGSLARECGTEEKTVKRHLNELVKFGYIERKAQTKKKNGKWGFCRWLIKAFPSLVGSPRKINDGENTQKPSGHFVRGQKASTPTMPKSVTVPANNNSSDLIFSDLLFSSVGDFCAKAQTENKKEGKKKVNAALVQEVKTQITYEDLAKKCDTEILDVVVDVIARVYAGIGSDLSRALRENYTLAEIENEYRTLTSEHIRAAIGAITRKKQGIKAIRRFVSATLLNARRDYEANLRIEQHDFVPKTYQYRSSSFDDADVAEICSYWDSYIYIAEWDAKNNQNDTNTPAEVIDDTRKKTIEDTKVKEKDARKIERPRVTIRKNREENTRPDTKITFAERKAQVLKKLDDWERDTFPSPPPMLT